MTLALPLVPLLGAAALFAARAWLARLAEPALRRTLAGASLVTMGALGALAAIAIGPAPGAALGAEGGASFAWGGGLALSLRVVPEVAVAIGLLPLVACPVLVWSSAREPREGLPRLIAGLLGFVGAMELLLLANDWLTLTVGWELVGAISYALIAHRWQERATVGSAAYAYNATRAGGLGLLLAAGGSVAATGSLSFDALGDATATAWGHWIAAGVLLAAASKSAQLPFSPWLFRAMEGPSGVSALLHSSTMVAAGAWLLVRLSGPLSHVGWLGPVTIAIGLSTAIAGGLVAVAQPHAKRLLAASTSTHYGLMFVAAGAGAAGAALSHLVMHALFKALLFLLAGAAMREAGSGKLARMRLGGAMPLAAAASWFGALSLAGAPPLGGGWSKERVVAAAGEVSVWLSLATIGAAGLGALYAMRFQLLAFGRREPSDEASAAEPSDRGSDSSLERFAFGSLAVAIVASSFVWWPGAEAALESRVGLRLPKGPLWELALSVAVVLSGAGLAWALDRRGALAELGHRRVAGWLGLPELIEIAVSRPLLAAARCCARFDDRAVDAGVRAAAAAGDAIAVAASFVLEGTGDRLATGATWMKRAARRGRGPRRGLLDGLVHALASGAEWAAGRGRRLDERVLDGFARAVGRAGELAALQSRTADDDGIDGAVLRATRGVGLLGHRARRVQSGAVPTYYAIVVLGAIASAAILASSGW